MKNWLLLIVVFIFLIGGLFVACKKGAEQPLNNTLILGQWELIKYGTDTNKNGLLDTEETISVSGFGKLLVFNNYGYYNAINIIGFSRDTVIGQWILEDNGNTLRTTSKTDTAKFAINTLTKTSLVLHTQSTGSGTPYWQVFKKN